MDWIFCEYRFWIGVIAGVIITMILGWLLKEN